MTKFIRTDKQAKDHRGQAALVLAALSTEVGQTIPEITAKIKAAGLVTRQDPDRISAYYLTIFKKTGVVATVPDVVTTELTASSDVVSEETEVEEIAS